MKQPFGGLFGDTCETRLLQFLLPMYGIEFDMAELIDEVPHQAVHLKSHEEIF
jgi:hypothetical protein